MRILIAEDDAALASFVCKGLESEHYAVDISAEGEQARAMAAERVLHDPAFDGVIPPGRCWVSG